VGGVRNELSTHEKAQSRGARFIQDENMRNFLFLFFVLFLQLFSFEGQENNENFLICNMLKSQHETTKVSPS
jgi:hypothetical protein